jgi:hypothetical protein
MADGDDGAAVRAPRSRAPGRLCRSHQHPWHKHGTARARLRRLESSDVTLSLGKHRELNGGPCRSRTYDQEIKSLLLYQLS